jgi:hypothetical protein
MPNPNKVFLNQHDIIEIQVIGDQTYDTVTAMGEKAARFIEPLVRQGKPVLVLDDLRQMKKVTPEGRKQVVALAKKFSYDKLAMVGDSGILRLGSNLMFQAIGKGNKLRYFEDYDKALAWLLAD